MTLHRETIRAFQVAFVTMCLMGGAILVGSRNLEHFDSALVGYTFATLFASFAVAYRYSMWLQRPPTALYWRKGWSLFLRRGRTFTNLKLLVSRLAILVALNRFIWRRDIKRGAAHWLIMWGCIIAALITFPLVFGWLHFDVSADRSSLYRVVVFGFPATELNVDSPLAHLMFHGLVIASFLVIPGAMLAMHRRMRDHDAATLQSFGEDFLPLILLFLISVTGLMLTVSYTWLRGYAYNFLAIFHAISVILTLVWMPFGKFFHIFQRPAQLGVAFYKDASKRGEQAACVRCGDRYAGKMHVEDLIGVERQLGYRYEMAGATATHYQWVCPRCRRLLLGISQGKVWAEAREGRPG